MTDYIYILILLFTLTHGLCSGISNWTPQLGSVQFPKSLSLSNSVRKGDVYRLDDGLFLALRDELPTAELEAIDGNIDLPDGWIELQHGSFLWPKSMETDVEGASIGDVFIKPDGSYWKVMSLYPLQFAPFHYKHRWMSELNAIIGDVRLGDLQYPGSHDSATSGIHDNSYLVNQQVFFRPAYDVAPGVGKNWSVTHDNSLGEQLELGFRWFDLRIADVDMYNDTFRWWHHLTGDTIYEGLAEIRAFAEDNPGEVIMLYFQHFAMPGNDLLGTRPIPLPRREILSDIILSYLGDLMVSPGNLSSNPTVNDILATGGNIVTIMIDHYIRSLDDRYWPNVIYSNWTGTTNPEDLFNQRSLLLADFHQNHTHQMTDASGACTPDEKSVTGGLKRALAGWDNLTDITDTIAPGAGDVGADEMSFEGVFEDLLVTHRDGVNSRGMSGRPRELYTMGASVHYRDIGDMYRHWLARPQKFKPNVLYIDDSASSTIVDVAMAANRGDIKQEVSVVMQGSGRHGYYTWNGYQATGGGDGYKCTHIMARYTVESLAYDLQLTSNEFSFGEVTFAEGEYPPDATVTVEVRGLQSSEWIHLYSNNIQDMIESSLDVYVRGNGVDDDGLDVEDAGFAYISEAYNVFGADCSTPPPEGYLNMVTWGGANVREDK